MGQLVADRAVCNPHHTLDQHLGWRLKGMDRLHGSELVMTQEFIANMCGVPRETEDALELQKAGLIDYARPHQGTRPAALEKRMCACYAVVKEQYDRQPPDLLAT